MPRTSDVHGDINLRSRPQMLEYEAMVDRVAANHPERVLDWGCGWGQISHMLLDRGLDVTSLEYRPDAVEGEFVALERYPDVRARLTREPVKLPYPDGHFDTVLSIGVLEHVEDPEASLDEIHRVLAPGGTVYVYKLPNRHSYLEFIARMLGFYYHGQLPHDRVYTLASARRMVEQHRFDVLEARRSNLLPLTLPGALATRMAPLILRLSDALARIPLLSLLATNVELVARAR